MTTTPPADRWPDPFATNTTDDHDPWAVEPAPTPAKRTPAPHQHDYTETTSPRGLALGYPSRPVCRTCGHVQANRPQDKSWAERLGLSVPEEFADIARRADEAIAATRRKDLDEMYRRVFADCEHDHTHLEVRDPDTLHRRRYVEICDDCTAQLREVDA